ncbi:MAG TPA: hypothetical protein VEC37_02885 [Bacillota bacterium]|nr:hypothetical protein [Bacillota bacterium]
MIIKDRLTLGVVSGVAATIPQLIFNYISVQLGYSQYYDFQISGSVYLYRNLTYTWGGMLLGGITWSGTGAGLGIVTVYLMDKTGSDYWWLKGILISNAIMYTFIYGFFFSSLAPTIVPWDLGTNFSMIIENALYGISLGFLVVRWGGF